METSYEIVAYAKNTVFHRTAACVLDGDGNFSDYSRSDGREYRDEKDALAYFNDCCTQQAAQAFTAHTDVTFELIESTDDDDEVVDRTLKSAFFKVEAE